MENSETNRLRDTLADIRESYGSGRQLILAALDKCYQCLCDVNANQALFDELAKLYKEAKFKKQKTTDAAIMVVRSAIVRDRKKANPYAIVFRKALDASVDPDEFLNWVEERGGIERIRLSNTAISKKLTDAEVQEIREAGKKHLGAQTATAIVDFDKPVAFDGEVALLVVKRSSNDPKAKLQLLEVLDAETSTTKAYLTHCGREAEKQHPVKAAA